MEMLNAGLEQAHIISELRDRVAQLEERVRELEGEAEQHRDRECPVCGRTVPLLIERRLASHMAGEEPCTGSNIRIMGIRGNELAQIEADIAHQESLDHQQTISDARHAGCT